MARRSRGSMGRPSALGTPTQVQPKIADPLALLFPACLVTPNGRQQGWRQHHLASRCCGLWNTERKSLAGPAQRAPDLKHALSRSTFSQRSGSSLPRRMPVLTASMNRTSKRLPAAAARSARACSTVRATTSTCLAWWSDERHDVSWQQTPPDGLSEGAVQDRMQVADPGRGEARRKLFLVEPLEVLRCPPSLGSKGRADRPARHQEGAGP